MNDRTSRAEDDVRKGPQARSDEKRRARRGDSIDTARAPAAAGLEVDLVWNAVRSPLRLQLLEAIATRPGATARELAEALGTSAPRLHYHLNIMVKAGLVRSLPQEAARSAGSSARDFPRGGERGRPNGSSTATGYELARAPALRAGLGGHRTASERLSALLVELASAGIAEAEFAAETPPRQDGEARATGFARCGREALAPHEVDSLHAHLREIDAIFGRARERRRRAKSLVAASVFVSICVASVSTPSLPDGLIGWGAPASPPTAAAASPNGRHRVRRS